jgi:ABC-type uncharacterized transport system involved in gliding motility auxiliary subunit
MIEPRNQNQLPEDTENELEQEPFIPPQYLLFLSILGFVVAGVVALTQPTFSVVGYGGLAFGVLALLAWVLLAPQQAKALLTGRTAQFGGTSLLVTVIVLVALIAVYTLVRNQNWQLDLTESDTFSLTPESEQAVAGIGADPNVPPVKLIAFYGAAQASRRDQDSVLFDDYAQTSNGKISYEFLDLDRNPAQAELYGVTRAGQIAVVALNEAGEPDVENAALVNFADQGEITNAILKVAASGEFQAFFLTVQDNVSSDMSAIKNSLINQYDWTVEDVSLLELTGPQAEFRLNDPNVDGQVIIIPGGSQPLADQELEVLQQYLNNGGDLIIFAGNNFNEDFTSLATAENLNAYLFDNFGLRFNNDVVLDQTLAFQSPISIISPTLDSTSFITTNGVVRGQGALIFDATHSIQVSDTPPANVTVTSLARSGEDAYATSDYQRILDGNFNEAEGDAQGPFVVAASAENTETGARIVLYGSPSIGADLFSMFQNVDNLDVAFNSLVWTTNFNNFFSQITVQQQQRPQDAPLFADAQTLRNINFITMILLPFGILLIGVFVWWNGRERQRS